MEPTTPTTTATVTTTHTKANQDKFFKTVLAIFIVLIILSFIVTVILLANNRPPANNGVLTSSSTANGNSTAVNASATSNSAGSNTTESDTLTFSSTRYKLSFNYPKNFGTIKVAYNPTYFKNEGLSFTDSPITLSYTRFEGGDIAPVKFERITSGEGKQFTVSIFGQGGGKYYVFASAQDPKNASASVVIQARDRASVAEAEAQATLIKQLISTLKFDFSDLK